MRERMKSALLPLSVCLIFLNCSSGPKLNFWVVSDEFLVDGSGKQMSWNDAAGKQMICVSPDDLSRAMSSCKDGVPIPKLNHCVFGFDHELHEVNLACADGYITPIRQVLNWACLTPAERNRAAVYCKEKQMDMFSDIGGEDAVYQGD